LSCGEFGSGISGRTEGFCPQSEKLALAILPQQRDI
jgi:hypothetical protein